MAPLWLRRLCLLLLLCMTVVSQTRSKRRKREWILPATKLIENVDYTKKEFIAKIWSDKHTEDKPVEYSLTGHGADREPYNLFVVNPQNGWVRITRILDREERSEYNLKGQARYRNGSLAEGEVLLKIQVTDQNDNPPKFTFSEGSVTECSQIGTPVMKITAEDADEPGTINTKIAYSIVKQKPDGAGPMFSINRDTGDIYVKEHTLDRETHDSYTLIVQGVDMDGAPGGKTGTGTVEIKVLDINDNAPTLEQDEHINHVDEDVDDVVVMRLKALDKDLEYTDNWRVLFKIIEGNEDGHFTIETDPNTNEGILKLVKPVDYEVVKEMNLDLVVSNVAPFINGTATSMDSERNLGGNGAGAGDAGGGGQAGAGAGAGGGGGGGGNGTGLGEGGGGAGAEGGGPAAEGKRYRVKVMVNNLSDGLAFSPSEKTFPVSEDPKKIQVPKIIGSFPAVDGDTGKPAENVRYAKGYDPDNWLSIDEDTSEIKLVKIPDRESKFLVNGTYYAKILCMTEDVPPKTITGTIALKVEDANDHCPRLTSNYESICSDTKIVNVTALDQDIYPNAEPYKFVLVKEETRGEWEMVPVNGTTVSFHAKDELWPGLYELTLEITDMQGLGCEDKQKLEVEVCTCEEGNTCVVAPRASQQRVSSVNMGAPAIGLLIAGLALLMLIPMLLLFCQCGALSDFTELSLDAKENLLSYHTEGKGEDKEVPLLSAPVQRPMAASATFGSKVPTMPSPQAHEQVMQTDSMLVYQNNTFSANHHRSDLYASSFRPGKHDMYGGIALPDHFLHGYFAQKAKCAAENPPLKDSLLVYSHEGQDSPVGSLDCCSLLDSGSDMTFLNDLGPKFIALAEICCPPKPSPPPPKAEQIVQTVDTTIKNESCASASIVPLSEPVPSLPQQSNVDTKALNSSDTLSSMNISQIQLVQQQQPLYYLVDHQVPSTVIIAERPMQGTYLINGSAETGGLILQDSNTAQASLNGVYLIRETSVLQDNYLIDSLSNPSSPGSPTSPSFLVQGNCLQHHDSISQITVPGMQRMVLLQSAGNVVPAVLSQTPSIGPKHPGEVGNRLDPQRSPSQDSSRNVFMHQQETMSFNTMSQPEEAQAQLNTKADTEQFSKQVHTDYTSDEAQMTIPPHMKVMHPILSDLPLQKSTTADILAKANAIRKELEETMLNQGFNKQVSPTRQENKSTDDTIKTANLSTTCQEDKKEVQESECQGSENEANLPGKDPSVSPDGPGQKEKVGVIMEEINSDDPEEIICEQSLIQQVEDEEEIVSSQLKMEDLPVIETQVETLAAELNNGSDQDLAGASDVTLETPQDISGLEVDTEAGLVNDYQVTLLTKEEDLKPEPGQQNLEEVKLAGSDSEREDAEVKSRIQMTEDMTVMEEVDLNDDSEQENLVELLDVNQKVPQGVTEEVATGVVPDFQVALPPEVVKEELNPELQIMEEVKKNEHGPSQINMSVKFDLTDTALKSEDVGDQLGSSIQKIKDIPVMEHMQITDVEVNDQLHQELVETGSDLQDPTYLRQSAPVDPESDEEADLEEAISSLSQSCTQTELEQRIAMRQYIEALEVDTETPVQVPTGQMKPEGIRNISIQNESLTLRQSPELRKTTEKNYYYYFDKESANNVPDCQILPADLMFQEDVDSSEDISAEEVDAQMTANTPIKTREYHPEIQILGEEEGISQAECCDPSQSAFTNLKSVSGGLEDEIHLILPQAEMAETKACAALPEEDDLTEIDAEKASDVSSEVMEQVSPTASNTSESEAAGLQMKSEEDATVSPKIKHRNSKSSKKVTSPKSPARHCKSQ